MVGFAAESCGPGNPVCVADNKRGYTNSAASSVIAVNETLNCDLPGHELLAVGRLWGLSGKRSPLLSESGQIGEDTKARRRCFQKAARAPKDQVELTFSQAAEEIG